MVEESRDTRELRFKLRGERKVRSDKLAAELQALPKTIDNPFFFDLQARWPQRPTMSAPVSQLCTSAQFAEPDFKRICKMMKVGPRLHRKQWEFIFIARCLEVGGMLREDATGLGFGVGREKLVAFFVSQGCQVLATDLPKEEADGHWVRGLQHSATVDNLFHPQLVDRERFYANTKFRPVNMNAIPSDIKDFDFCWSACALEHLGSLKHGLDFVRNSVRCLKPGGVAVHTTEFNLHSPTETFVDGPSVAYRESDLLAFQDEMVRQGHSMQLNLHPGDEPTDLMVDRDRNSDIHLRLYVRHKFLATSLGIFIRKAA